MEIEITGRPFRQGDVLVVPVNRIPDERDLESVPRENGFVVLAHGEVTGHAHKVHSENAALFRDPKLMAIFLNVTGEPVALAHDEHDPIQIPPGNYRVIRQREYSPDAIRQVAD